MLMRSSLYTLVLIGTIVPHGWHFALHSCGLFALFPVECVSPAGETKSVKMPVEDVLLLMDDTAMPPIEIHSKK